MYKFKNFGFFVTALVCLVVLFGCGAKSNERIDSGSDLSILIATDIHYLAPDINDGGRAFQSIMAAGDGRQLNYVEEIMDAFANDVMNKKADVLIISGDLTQNGEKASHLSMAEKLASIERTAGTRVFVIPGNHDIQNAWAREFTGDERLRAETITQADFADIYKNFAYDEAISRDKSTLSYLAAPSEDVWLLMLDTNAPREKSDWPKINGVIGEDTFTWMKQCSELAKAANARIVTVMHHNLLNHSPVLYEGFTLDNGKKAVEKFAEFDLNIVLSGHVHIQDIKSTLEGSKEIFDIATSSLSVYPIQYGELQYSPAKGFDYSTARVDVEGWAEEMGEKDEKLLDFENYSKDYFAQISYCKAFEALNKSAGLSADETVLMAETMSLLNLNYFGGTTSAVVDRLIETEGHKLWTAAEPGFLSDYVLSMLESGSENNNQVQISIVEK